MRNQKITVVIPTLNDEKTIKKIIEGVKPYCNDILVVISKKSKDKTESIVKSCNQKYIFDNGKGKGEALRLAIETVAIGIIVFIDADGSHDPKDIPRLVKPIKEDKADMVIGSRMTGGSDELHGNLYWFIRLVLGSIITLIINYRFRVNITDHLNGYRALNASIANRLGLVENIASIEPELGIKFLKKGYRVMEVPAHEYRGKNQSTLTIRKSGFRFFWCVMRNIL